MVIITSKFRVCWKRKKNNSFLQIFLSVLGKYLRSQVYCIVSHSHQNTALEMSAISRLAYQERFKILIFPCVNLLINLQHGGKIWYTYLRQIKCEISGYGFCVNAHIYIFTRRKMLSTGSAVDSLQVHMIMYVWRLPPFSRCPSARHSLVIWICLVSLMQDDQWLVRRPQ